MKNPGGVVFPAYHLQHERLRAEFKCVALQWQPDALLPCETCRQRGCVLPAAAAVAATAAAAAAVAHFHLAPSARV